MRALALLAEYGKSRKGYFLLILLQLFLLFLVCWLYDLPLRPVEYAAILMAALFFLFIGADFRRFARRVRRLEEKKAQPSCRPDGLDEIKDLDERLFWEILQKGEALFEEERQKLAKDKADTALYYGLWSHQAKTPLAAMDLLLQGETPDKGLLEQQLFHARQYVDLALQYQRLNALSTDLVLCCCRLDEIVKQAVKEVSILFIYKKLRLDLGDLPETVLTDAKWLRFVIVQLLSNAIKYTPAGGISIWSGQGELYIRDTGVGIDPEDLPRIFEWGYTGGNGHKTSRSTGVGLNLCKRALDMLGHTITVQSVPGCGTTVVIGLVRQELEVE